MTMALDGLAILMAIGFVPVAVGLWLPRRRAEVGDRFAWMLGGYGVGPRDSRVRRIHERRPLNLC